MAATEKCILVVDDDDAIRKLLFTILRRRGLAVDVAKDGIEALERLDQCAYALVLLDLMMPRLSGWEVLRRIGERPRGERPVVIVLTAGPEPRDFDPDVVAGTLRKPFEISLLLEAVQGCIAAVEPRAQLPGCPPDDSDHTIVRGNG